MLEPHTRYGGATGEEDPKDGVQLLTLLPDPADRVGAEAAGSEGAAPALRTVDHHLDLAARVEALLFVADRPVAVQELAQVLGVARPAVEAALQVLEEQMRGRGVRLQREGRNVQAASAPEAADDVQRFLGLESSTRLSGPALETLAIVAYRQPVTRPEIEELRGVNCDGVIRTLMARGLVAELGRRDTVGLPIEYGTTFRFLEYFGLASLDDLPPVAPESVAAPPAEPAGAPVAGAHAPDEIQAEDALAHGGTVDEADTPPSAAPDDG